MLHSKPIILMFLVFKIINTKKKIILDPVMIAKGGAKLINDEAIKILKSQLIKKVSLITPNIPEAEVLTGVKIYNKNDMILAANKLIDLGAKNVLIKGGHLNSRVVNDIFLNKSEIKIFNNIKAQNEEYTWHWMHIIKCNCNFFHVEKVL